MQDLMVNKLFLRDIAQTIKQYPKLQLQRNRKGKPILTGKIEIFDGVVVVECFNVIIEFTNEYPFAYPLVYETSGRFPNNLTFHIFKDGHFCLNTIIFEKIDTRLGLSTIDFINRVFIPNLAWRMCKLESLTKDLKEFSHGFDGIVESYQTLMKTDDLNEISSCLNFSASNTTFERNEKCFCGCGKKFKNCHSEIIDILKLIPIETLKQHQEKLIEHKKTKV